MVGYRVVWDFLKRDVAFFDDVLRTAMWWNAMRCGSSLTASSIMKLLTIVFDRVLCATLWCLESRAECAKSCTYFSSKNETKTTTKNRQQSHAGGWLVKKQQRQSRYVLFLCRRCMLLASLDH